MHHVAIMKKSWGLIPKILSGKKTMESRWYQTKRAPWDKISAGDTVFFKNSSELVTAKAIVSTVMQFKIETVGDAVHIIKRYGKKICLVNNNPATWSKLPKYCILLGLRNAQPIKIPFQINKQGFGNGAAWLTVKNITIIRPS